MIGTLLEHADLQRLLDYQRQADIERCLREQGIRYFYGRGGVWTTLDLVNAAGGLRPGSNDDSYSPDIVG